MNKIHILSSTDRPGSNALKVSNYVGGLLKDHAEVEIFSLKDFPFEDVVGGNYGKDLPRVDEFNHKFLDADGYLFVVPEYNGGFPGVAKLFFDYLPFPNAIEQKPVSFIGEADGSFGALRPIEHLQALFIYRKAVVYPERMFISGVSKNFDEENGLKSEFLQGLLKDQLSGFAKFVAKLSD